MFKNISLAIIIVVGTLQLAIGQKFGYLDTELLISEMQEMTDANAQMEAYRDSLTKVGENMITTLEAKYGTLSQNAPNMSPIQQQEEAKKLKQEEQAIIDFERKSQQELMLKSEALINPIQMKINTAIQDVAAEGGFTYIFDSSLGIILYADQSINVFDLVKAKLSK